MYTAACLQPQYGKKIKLVWGQPGHLATAWLLLLDHVVVAFIERRLSVLSYFLRKSCAISAKKYPLRYSVMYQFKSESISKFSVHRSLGHKIVHSDIVAIMFTVPNFWNIK
jgi:hypothetical protein